MSRLSIKKKSPLVWVFLFIVMLGLAFVIGSTRLSSVGYTTAYEGAKATFQGVYYNNQAYEGGSAFRGTTMKFDPDDPTSMMPNVEGEMTSIFIPEKVTFGSIPAFVPSSWTAQLSYINNPVEYWDWTVTADKSPDGKIHTYRMEKWITKWYMSFEAGFDSNGWSSTDEGNSQRLKDLEVWIKLDTQPTWYFKGATQTYFTIGKIECGNLAVKGHDVNWIDVTPEASGSNLYLFYLPYGQPVNLSEETFKGFAVGETVLNPALFRTQLYTMVTFNDFGTQGYWDGLAYKNQSDVVTWEFTVHQFVVGEWVTKDIQTVPPDYDRSSKTTTDGVPIKDWLVQWLTSPQGLMAIGLFMMIIIAVILIILFTNPVFASMVTSAMNRPRPQSRSKRIL